MDIVFLDIDGVGNTRRTRREWAALHLQEGKPFRKDGLARHCIESLNQLLDQTGAKVVLSSTWRIPELNPDGSPANQDGTFQGTRWVQRRLREEGFRHDIIDETQDSGTWDREKFGDLMRQCGCPHTDGFERILEIQEWLNRHPWVERFVILDDIHHFGKFQHRHVCSNDAHGFSPKQLKRALRLLKDE
jgi:hypothetical protein